MTKLNNNVHTNINDVSEKCRKRIKAHIHGKNVTYVIGYNHESDKQGIPYKLYFSTDGKTLTLIEYVDDLVISTPEIIAKANSMRTKRTKRTKKTQRKHTPVFGSVNRKLDL